MHTRHNSRLLLSCLSPSQSAYLDVEDAEFKEAVGQHVSVVLVSSETAVGEEGATAAEATTAVRINTYVSTTRKYIS